MPTYSRAKELAQEGEYQQPSAIAVVEKFFTVKGGYFGCSKLLNCCDLTAIVAGNELTAIGILHRAYDSRKRVPDELSVIGFDDILFAEYTQPALTTVALPRPDIGKVAFDALWAMISDAELAGREFRVEPRLVVRQSCRSLQSGSG